MRKRPITRSVYIIAFIISALLFLIGLMLGWYLGEQTASKMQEEFEKVQEDSYVLEILSLMGSGSNLSCVIYEKQAKRYNDDADRFLTRLDYIENQRGKQDPEVMRLKSAYSLMEIRNFLLLSRIKQQCNGTYVFVLYFYSNQVYDQRVDQGMIIEKVRQKNPERMITYSFDVDVNNAAVDAFKNFYNITVTPAVIIDGVKYEGFMEEAKIESIIEGRI